MSVHHISSKKKLFLIINRLALAGGSMDALSLAFYLKEAYDITVVYGEKEKDEQEAPLPPGAGVTFIKLPTLRRAIQPLNDLRSYRQLSALIRRQRPHIVHTHGFKSGLLGRLAAWRAAVPVILHTYHGHLFHSYYNGIISTFIAFVERSLAAVSTRIVAISPRQAHDLSAVYRIAPASKISTVFIGIDVDHYDLHPPPAHTLRQQYNLPENMVLIGIISRLVTIKNLPFFTEVIARLKPREKGVCFFVIGDGHCKNSMQRALSQKGILWYEGNTAPEVQPYVIFTSWITPVSRALHSLDVVVLTSLNEGTPVSLIEAQLFEKPVVATNVGGVSDAVKDGETGFLINGFDVAAFAEKLQLLIHDKSLRAAMGQKGKAFVLERFSKTKEVAGTDALYRQCLAQKGIV